MAYRAVDNHVSRRVQAFLVRRHKVPTHGTRRFSTQVIYERMGVVRLRRIHLAAPSCALG